MSLTFLLDEDISYRVAQGLRQREIDAISVYELGRANRRTPDEDQLALAAAQGRVLVTYNRGDYQALDATWRLRELTHAGIVWCTERSIPRRAIGDLVRAIEALGREHDSLRGICIPLPRVAA